MASEIVTPLIWEVGAEAYKDRAADGCYPDTGAFTAALQAVAPLIRRAALEEAAGYVRRQALDVSDGDTPAQGLHSYLLEIENAIRALATQEPGR